jgi:NAD-dependent dihydropyrimidine dehydrogenase PreA subunit
MEMRVNDEFCKGCGDCIPACPTAAISLHDGLAILDQENCSQCMACVDACPQGAITFSELPVAASEPAIIQTRSQVEIVAADPVRSATKPWLTTMLAFTGQEILPRLADVLVGALDRQITLAQNTKSQAALVSQNNTPLIDKNSRSGYRRRLRRGEGRRFGKGRCQDRGEENGLNRSNERR